MSYTGTLVLHFHLMISLTLSLHVHTWYLLWYLCSGGKQSSEITKQGRRAFKVLILLLLFLLREQLSRISLQASSSVALKGSSNMFCLLEVPRREGRERDCPKGRLQKTWIRGGYSRPAHRPPSIHPSMPNFYYRTAKSPVSLKHQSGACSEINGLDLLAYT